MDTPAKDIKKSVKKVIKGDTLDLCPITWEIDDKAGANGALQIIIFCLNAENVPVAVRIEDFAPHIYFEFPKPNKGADAWNLDDAALLHAKLKKIMGTNGKFLLPFMKDDFSLKQTLYYYQPKPIKPMCKLSFINCDALKHAKNILNKGIFMEDGNKLIGKVHEFEIEPIRKMLTSRRIATGKRMTHCGWFRCTAIRQIKEIDKITTLKYEYICSHTTLEPFNSDILVRPLWLSYDGEMYSHNHKAFPNMQSARDPIYLMTMVFFRDGDDNPENWVQYGILKGDCDETLISGNSIIVKLKSEMGLINKWAELIMKHDPDLLTGYNILAFDNKYVNARLELRNQEWPVTGRLKGKTGPARNLNWGSAAYGKKDLYIPKSFGRTYLDEFEHMRRSYNWGIYSLDNAAKFILKDVNKVKKDVSPEKQFIGYDLMQAALKARKKGEPPSSCTILKGMQAMAEIVDYGMWDSRIVCHIANKISWWIGIKEMCNVVGVNAQVLLTQGEQIRVLNLLYDECTSMSIVLDTRTITLFYYEGGLVQQPDVGFHERAFTLDFKSLYPSIMIGHNLCFTTLIHPNDHKKYAAEDYTRAPVMICDQDDSDTDIEAKKKKADLEYYPTDFRFIKKKTWVGVLPIILRRLLDERARVRKIKSNDPIINAVNDKRQLALKVCSNAIYGFTGGKKGAKRSCLEVAATTTYLGREAITDSINDIKAKWDCHLVYGDTDSCMMTKLGIPANEMHAFANMVAKVVSARFPQPMELECEGIFDIFAIKPKNYAKFTYWDPGAWNCPAGRGGTLMLDDNDLPEILIKGLAPTRRDICQWIKDVLIVLLMFIMRGYGYWECVDYLYNQVVSLYNGEIPIDKFVITKSLGAGYKNDNATMNVFSQEMAKIGKQMNPGERHAFVVVNVDGQKKIGNKMLLLSVYQDQQDKYELDHNYYFKNLLMKRADVILDAAYGRYASELDRVCITIRGRTTTARKPAKLLSLLIANNLDIDKVATKIQHVTKNIGVR
jgi:DNA polymerase delta subunit 1